MEGVILCTMKMFCVIALVRVLITSLIMDQLLVLMHQLGYFSHVEGVCFV